MPCCERNSSIPIESHSPGRPDRPASGYVHSTPGKYMAALGGRDAPLSISHPADPRQHRPTRVHCYTKGHNSRRDRCARKALTPEKHARWGLFVPGSPLGRYHPSSMQSPTPDRSAKGKQTTLPSVAPARRGTEGIYPAVGVVYL